MPRYKKAQIGETITWLVATVVIVGILMIFLYVSILLSKTKTINIGNFETSDSDNKTDLLNEKTSLAHQLADDKNKEVIDNILKENGQKNE